MNTNVSKLWRKRRMKTRTQLMQELNFWLGTDYNWSRLNLLDLNRLVDSIENKCKKVKKNAGQSPLP